MHASAMLSILTAQRPGALSISFLGSTTVDQAMHAEQRRRIGPDLLGLEASASGQRPVMAGVILPAWS